MENKLSKLQADQALWQDIFLKNAELENELKKEKEWRIQLQASTETTKENFSQLAKDLSFYKKVAHVSYFILIANRGRGYLTINTINVIELKQINLILN